MVALPAMASLTGSSPLVRGQPMPYDRPVSELRIIPARAGPTLTICLTVTSVTDHPRSCGANVRRAVRVEAENGSSPLVRGQLQAYDADSLSERIIPARAGPTPLVLSWITSRPDHPRSCGANVTTPRPVCHDYGSSPLVRGQPGVQESHAVHERIIPARAGPT